MYDWIGPEYRERASTQTYGARARIEGVRLIDLTVFSDEGGDFCEITRVGPDGALVAVPEYRPAQMSYSYMEPGTVKAWHLHQRQDDVWFVPPRDRLLVGLLDTREGSASYGASLRLTLGAGKARLLLIPRGVAHGVANLTPRPASVVYFSNTAFDATNPDEHRLPWDILGAGFWQIEPG